MRSHRLSVALTAIALLCGSQAQAREVLPYVCAIPQRLAASAPPGLESRVAALQQQRSVVSGDIAAFEGQCGRVRSDDHGQLARCRSLQSANDGLIGNYLRERAALNEDIRALATRSDIATRAAIASLDLKIANTRAKIKEFDLQVRGLSGSLEEWTEAAEQARKAMRAKAFEGLMGQLTTGLLRRKEKAVALDRKLLDHISERLAKVHVPQGAKIATARARQLQAWTVYLHNYAATFTFRVKENMTDLEVVEALKQLTDINKDADLANALVDFDGTYKQNMNTALATLKLFVKNPILDVFIDQVELDISLAFLLTTEIHAEARVDQLNALGTQNLLAVSKLGELYRNQIDERKKLRQTLAPASVDANGCLL